MTDVIADRTYDFKGRDGVAEVIKVQIGKPAPTADTPTPAWYCPWLVVRGGKRRKLAASGEDSLQALLLALSGLRTDLQLAAEQGKLSYEGIDGPSIDLVG